MWGFHRCEAHIQDVTFSWRRLFTLQFSVWMQCHRLFPSNVLMVVHQVSDRQTNPLCTVCLSQVVNLQYSEVQDRVMLTGRHMVRDVSCKNCNSKLGWIYEFATEDSQRYKEGRVILERALVRESEGFEEHVPSDNSWRGSSLFSGSLQLKLKYNKINKKICLHTLSP